MRTMIAGLFLLLPSWSFAGDSLSIHTVELERRNAVILNISVDFMEITNSLKSGAYSKQQAMNKMCSTLADGLIHFDKQIALVSHIMTNHAAEMPASFYLKLSRTKRDLETNRSDVRSMKSVACL